jgi:hypothetical protein
MITWYSPGLPEIDKDNTSFYFQLTNGPKRYITLDWRGLPGTKYKAYWDHLKVSNKMKCCENDSRVFASYG